MRHNRAVNILSASGRIVLIGSGEIGPSMAPLHRSLVASLPERGTPSTLVALDGSYDFQTNRAEMGEKIFLAPGLGQAPAVGGGGGKTGRTIRYKCAAFHRYRDGKLIEYIAFHDGLDLMQQLLGQEIAVPAAYPVKG